MAGGGATVAPATIGRYITHSDGKWIVHAESGKVLGTHDNEADAKKQLAAIEAHKDRTGPWIEATGHSFIVRAVDDSAILYTDDGALAADTITAMTSRRTFEQINREILTVLRAAHDREIKANQEFKADVQAMIDLMVHGRV